ncbi:TATA box-binding protein associated factor RNA polymerase I subunit B-like protein [Medicago truncatula]|uniref:TATA box-binding protein associated factor RNA polymerase I subunit B-like protein n=1 Tax=Medicago truncatula TaxID=3880 RepID=A0A072UJP8_MEDTR|nr:TATA box-binding protein associated factor RNA polymerase I subunit B-like protein [Medicago truncatula]
MADVVTFTCQSCTYEGEALESDGFYYCSACGEKNLDVVDTGAEEEDAIGAGIYLASHQRRTAAPTDAVYVQPISQCNPSQSNFLRKLGLEDDSQVKLKAENVDQSQCDPSNPADFGGSTVVSIEQYYKEIRLRYIMGLQMMIELQCEALVKEFKVTPLICGLVGPIWLRFVSKTGVFDDDWADKAIHDSEMQNEGEPEDYNIRGKYKSEPHNMFGQRAAFIWFRSLRNRIPVVCTIVVSYLACHIAREAIMPSDMIKWTCEGKLPYFSAFLELESRMGPPVACPISSSLMFRPQRALSVHKLESCASSISQFIGLELPPVNFYALAYRYLEKLSLPVEKILPYACRIYEWSMSPDLWLSLSKDYFKLPTHVCVVSVLVVAIRILYNINGYGEWEKSLSHNDSAKDSAKDPVEQQKHELDCTGLLQHLHAIYNEIADTHEYSKDLPTYLKYCKDVVFAGLEPSLGSYEETNMMEILWKHYQNEENTKPSESEKQYHSSFSGTGSRDEGCVGKTSKREKKKRKCLSDDNPSGSLPEAIRQLKLDMEENRFCYIPPSVKQEKLGYVHYVRKKDKGALSYVAHADYYILLRAFARAAHVDDIRILHIGVLNLERRLAWLEKRIGQCLHLKPPNISCEFCSVSATENGSDHMMDEDELSNLNIEN